MVLWKGNVLEIFLLGERRGENDTANLYHKLQNTECGWN